LIEAECNDQVQRSGQQQQQQQQQLS